MSKLYLVISCATVLFCGSVLAHNSSHAPDEPVTVLAAVAPIVPMIARQSRVKDVVKVEVTIDAYGIVQSTKTLGHPLVRAACENAAKKWRFNVVDSKAAPRTAQLKFQVAYGDKERIADDSTVTFLPPYEVEVKY